MNPLKPRYPDLLATEGGRLTAFFLLYLTEGILIGFMAIAVATQMRARSVGAAEIGVFVGALYLPAAWKWAFGPAVDLCYSDRLGRRRGWIVGTQMLIIVAILAARPIDFTAQIRLFTALMMLVNLLSAIQKIAIDALACNVLGPKERGLANGLMFAGAYLGQAVGGSGVLYLSDCLPFDAMYFLVAGSSFLVLVLVALPLREPRVAPPGAPGRRDRPAIAAEVGRYAREAFRAFVGSRAARVGLVFAWLPAGAYALSLSLGSNLMVEFGLRKGAMALLTLLSILISAAGCVVGGYLSDKFGRRKMLALYIVGGVLTTAWLGYVMHACGWILPIDPLATARPEPPAILLQAYWIATLAFSAFQGLMYGTRAALYMDICTPAVAATQFTAYMAMFNMVITVSSVWQGWAAEAWGYPATLALDAALGMACLPLLLGMKAAKDCSTNSKP